MCKWKNHHTHKPTFEGLYAAVLLDVFLDEADE